MLSTGIGDEGTGLEREIQMAFNRLVLNGNTSSEISRLRGEEGLGRGPRISCFYLYV